MMGNILCKDSPRRTYVKGPVKGSSSRSNMNSIYEQQQIHPDSLTSVDGPTPKRFNTNTNFFHSTPNLTDGQLKSMVSLDARIFDSGNNRTPPIAPPRKKRSTLKKGSTLPTTFGSGGVVPNGFKDVFIHGGASRVLKYDDIEYIDREEITIQTRAAVESDGESTPERKLKVGNKKTDKFFGESLSDHLSDEPVSLDETPQKVDKDETDNRRSSSSDKKLFFLMNMLDREHDDDDKYKDQVPVEEPVFIARKKEIKKHICDDDDHMHQHFHKNEKEPCDHAAVAPPKPDRDFSKYQANAAEQPIDKIIAEKIEETQTKVRNMKKSISRENLPTPPATPKRKSGYASLPGTPTITIESIDFNTSDHGNASKVAITHVEVRHEKESQRPPSLTISNENETDEILPDETPKTPILAHDLVDRMIKKAYGFHDYNPEDFTEHNHDDGSNLVAPTSKLTTRKISVTRKVSTESAPSIDGDSVGKSNELLPPGSPRKKTSTSSIDSFKSDGTESPRNSPKSPKKSSDYEKMLNASSINDIIDEIYSKNSSIMQEFQSYLEKTVEAEPVINVDAEKEFLKVHENSDSEFSRTPEPVKLPEVEDEADDNQSFSDSFESTDTEQETITEMNKMASRLPKYGGRRRESIEDVDNWFTKHLDLEETKSQTLGTLETVQQTTYDTHKIFPFGRTITGRRDSMSDEFFAQPTGSSMKPEIGTLRESESSISEDGEAEHLTREKSPDHSTLLKFLDKESKIN